MSQSLLRYLGRPRSLGSRLSRVLALQIFIGLTMVSLAVYLMIYEHLRMRQAVSMDRLEAFVEHLVVEAQESDDPGELDHKLRDFMIGHEDLFLELSSAGETVFYGTPSDRPRNEQRRTLEFLLPAQNVQMRARLSLNTAEDDALLRRLVWTLVSTTLLGAAAGSLGATWSVRRGLHPLADLDRQLHLLDASTLDQRLSDVGQPSELQPLIARFNELLQRLDGAYRELEGFNANVAHELKTPLATLVSNCELGLRGSYDTGALRELLSSNLEELERLAGVVRSMLFLSTAERGNRAQSEPIPSLASVARDVVDYHDAVIEEAGLRLAVEGDAPTTGNRMLLRQAISNLLSNATRHAYPNSEIRILIEPDTDKSLTGNEPSRDKRCRPEIWTTPVRVSVSNRGDTVPPEHLGKLFDRFYRVEADDNSAARMETRDRTGGTSRPRRHGLGLPIVNAIARMHGGTTFVESQHKSTSVGFTLPGSVPNTASANRTNARSVEQLSDG